MSAMDQIPDEDGTPTSSDLNSALARCCCVHAPEQHCDAGCTVESMFGQPCVCLWNGKRVP